jgi:glycosyltransferase involved in cell wall biosynthesis
VSSIVCVSQHDLLKLSAIAPTEKLFLIPNGIDEDKFISSDDDRDPTLIISVGRLARNKRYDKLLKAFARVQTSRPDSQLCLIGPDDGELLTLQKLAAQLTISEKTKFLGKLTNEELIKYLIRANVWVSSSEYESFGIGLLEAIASRCIPVVHPLQAFREILQDVSKDLFVDFDDEIASSQAILNVLNFRPETAAQIRMSVQKIASRYSWHRIMEKYIEVYSKY